MSASEWGNGLRYNFVLYLFDSFCYYHICILPRGTRTEVFLKTLFLKLSLSSQENRFIIKGTPAQCFPKPLNIFARCFIVDIRLGYKYTSVLPPNFKTNQQRLSSVKVSDKNYYTVLYHHRTLIIQRDKVKKQSNTS